MKKIEKETNLLLNYLPKEMKDSLLQKHLSKFAELMNADKLNGKCGCIFYTEEENTITGEYAGKPTDLIVLCTNLLITFIKNLPKEDQEYFIKNIKTILDNIIK